MVARSSVVTRVQASGVSPACAGAAGAAVPVVAAAVSVADVFS
jgi:hypothetical protein